MDYHDPRVAAIYELANPLGRDVEFYLALAGLRPSRILDLGCGTGTLCCALVSRGHQVTGVDPAEAMLGVARKKASSEQVEWIESSAQSYNSYRRFDLIVMTGHAFQVLLNDLDALAVLKTARGHLKDRGRFAFETRNPAIDWATEWSTRPPRMLSGGTIIENLEVTSAQGEFVSIRTSYRFPHESLTTHSTLRFPSRQHVESLLARSGLAVREVFGDWDGTAFEQARSREIIFVTEIADEAFPH